MLISFKVKNFRSYKTEQKLSMEAEKNFDDQLPENAFRPKISNPPELLKSMACYGANASGKSNLIYAIGRLQSFIYNSAKESQRGETIQWISPFKLDFSFRNQPSMFQVEFIHSFKNQLRHLQYGLALSHERVAEEWLQTCNITEPKVIFRRKYDAKKNDYIWNDEVEELGDLHKRVLPNVSYLSKAATESHPTLSTVFDWFANTLMVISPMAFGGDTIDDNNFKFIEDNKEKIVTILKDADLGITDLRLSKREINNSYLDSIPEQHRTFFKQRLQNKLESIHRVPGSNEEIAFDFFVDESAGTKRIFKFSPLIIRASTSPKVIIVDELDESLHPTNVRGIIQAFHSFNTNSQIIFTTHDVSLQSSNLLRPDQICLIDKSPDDLSSQIYRLSDYENIKKECSIDRRYLQGIYGATPNSMIERSFLQESD